MSAFKTSVTSADFWLRLVYTLLLALAWQVTELLLACVVVLQIGFRLFTGQPQARLAGFGNSLSQYAWQIGRYLTGVVEQKPWPFMEWPAADAVWRLQEAPRAQVADEPAEVQPPAAEETGSSQ